MVKIMRGGYSFFCSMAMAFMFYLFFESPFENCRKCLKERFVVRQQQQSHDTSDRCKGKRESAKSQWPGSHKARIWRKTVKTNVTYWCHTYHAIQTFEIPFTWSVMDIPAIISLVQCITKCSLTQILTFLLLTAHTKRRRTSRRPTSKWLLLFIRLCIRWMAEKKGNKFQSNALSIGGQCYKAWNNSTAVSMRSEVPLLSQIITQRYGN